MKIIILLISLLLTACSQQNTNILTIATSSGYPPYEMIDPIKNELIGFDIELGHLIAKELEMEAKFIDMSFDGVIASLATNQTDIALAGLSPDPNRDVLFSDHYYVSNESPFYLVMKEDSDNSIDNKKVGVQLGTIQETAAKQIQAKYNLTIDSRDSYTILIQELLIGRIDFLIMEPLVAQSYLNEFNELEMFELEEPELNKLLGNSIAFNKGNTKLQKEINEILQKFKDDSTLDNLIDKWFNK